MQSDYNTIRTFICGDQFSNVILKLMTTAIFFLTSHCVWRTTKKKFNYFLSVAECIPSLKDASFLWLPYWTGLLGTANTRLQFNQDNVPSYVLSWHCSAQCSLKYNFWYKTQHYKQYSFGTPFLLHFMYWQDVVFGFEALSDHF